MSTFDEDGDYGFTLVDFTDVDRLKRDSQSANEIADHYWENLQSLRALILPLLKNLSKNPEKDIHWPNRDVKLAIVIDKVNKLTSDNTRKGK